MSDVLKRAMLVLVGSSLFMAGTIGLTMVGASYAPNNGGPLPWWWFGAGSSIAAWFGPILVSKALRASRADHIRSGK